MRILCTNDDGVHAQGLKVVEQIARALSDDVWIVAPELDQSGVSHSLSLNDPLRLREIGPRHFAVRGTPTDCVIMGARHILGDRMPDLVLSGVNKGRNVAEDVVYSGTIAGALEGTILGLPSFALSQEFTQESREKPLWETALQFGPPILQKVIDAGVPIVYTGNAQANPLETNHPNLVHWGGFALAAIACVLILGLLKLLATIGT